MKKLLLLSLISFNCYASPQTDDLGNITENKYSKSKILDGLAQTNSGKTIEEKSSKWAKDNNLEYLAPAALLMGKLKAKINDNTSITIEQNKVTMGLVLRFP